MATQGRAARDIRATINYLDPALDRGRFDVVEPARTHMPFVAREVPVFDMRSRRPDLRAEGFTYASHTSHVAQTAEITDANLVARHDTPPINAAYYEELIPLIQSLSEARTVIPQSTGLTVRFSERATRRSWAGPAGFAHLDVTEKSAQRFLEFSLTAHSVPVAPWRRVVMYQTWRVLCPPPQDNLLALCDRRSVADADVVFYDAIVGDKGTALESVEARGCRYSPQHRWWFVPDLSPVELLVFIGFDSAEPRAVQPYHTGIDLPRNEHANPRASLEARFFAFYD